MTKTDVNSSVLHYVRIARYRTGERKCKSNKKFHLLFRVLYLHSLDARGQELLFERIFKLSGKMLPSLARSVMNTVQKWTAVVSTVYKEHMHCRYIDR